MSTLPGQFRLIPSTPWSCWPTSASVDAILAAHIRSRCVEDDDCLLWRGALNNNGVPTANIRGLGQLSPRKLLWLAAGNREVKGRIFSLPRCYNERCIAPGHQCHVTRESAMRKAAKDGRMSSGQKHAAAVTPGMRRRSKISDATVAKMRALYRETNNAALVSRKFKISHSYAHRICRNDLRREVTPFSGLSGRSI